MRGILLAYSIGVMLATFALQPSKMMWWCAVLVTLLVCIYPFVRKRTCYWQMCLRLSLAAGVGAGWHCLWAANIIAARLPADLEGRDMQVIGVVTSLPATNADTTQFQFYIEHGDSGFTERLVLLNYYGESVPVAGQRWALQVRLNRPRGFANPGGFDYEAWLFQQGISAKGYVRSHPGNRLLGEGAASLSAMRDAVRRQIISAAGDLSSIGILLALSLGDRSQMQPADWQLMSASGTNHLFVISGLHIGLIAMAVYWLVNSCLRWLPKLSVFYPRQKSAQWCALLAALLYSLLAGFTLPTQRAFIMTAVFILGQISSRPVPVSARFLLALALVLTVNPLAALNAGFWFSFAAVAALLLCLNAPRQYEQTPLHLTTILRKWLLPQTVVFLALSPFLLFWVHQVSLLSPLINMIAIPLVGLLVVPLILFGVTLLAFSSSAALLLFRLSDFLIEKLFTAMQLVTSSMQWSLLEVQVLSYPLLFCIGIGMGLMLAPVSRYMRLLVVPLLLPVIFPDKNALADGALDVHILDVGQGLSVIVQTQNHTLVYDTGAALSPEFNLGSAVVVPVLRQLGVSVVNTVVVSHFDNDHAGGLATLLTSIQVNNLFSSDLLQAQQRLRAMSTEASDVVPGTCLAGDRWHWDGVDFVFLHPKVTEEGSNNNSCVLQIRVGENAVLLPGDIESAAERALVLRHGSELRSTVLVAPHHGSNTSSTYAFIKQVRPRFVVYTVGYRNSFGHPTGRIRQRYAEAGADEFVTHHSGMLSFHLPAAGPVAGPDYYRGSHRRYWH